MTLTPVKSSMIQAVGYDHHQRVMSIQFKNGKTYDVPGVGVAQHAAMLTAPSIGKHFNTHFRSQAKAR